MTSTTFSKILMAGLVLAVVGAGCTTMMGEKREMMEKKGEKEMMEKEKGMMK